MSILTDLLEGNLLSVFNQRDGRRRRAALKELWTADGVLRSVEGTYVGHRAVERAAASLLRRYPEYDFASAGEVDEIPDAARMCWSFGAVSSAPAITGMDVVTASNVQHRVDVQISRWCWLVLVQQ